MTTGKYKHPIIYRTNPNTIICDLDGTLSLLNGRNPYKPETCYDDKVNIPVSIVLEYAHDNFDKRDAITFLSGREDKYRPETIKFLDRAVSFLDYNLFMRETGDFRKDSIVKKELFDTHIKDKYNVLFVMDDRNQVVDMWRNELKLTCFQVAEGNF